MSYGCEDMKRDPEAQRVILQSLGALLQDVETHAYAFSSKEYVLLLQAQETHQAGEFQWAEPKAWARAG